MDVTLVDPAGEARTEIATFIGARNGDSAQHIGYLGEDADDVGGTIGDLYAGAVFALAHDDGELVGVLGTDWDLDVGRAWLYGPYGWGSDELYAALTARIPAGLEHELYCSDENDLVIGFAARNGFSRSSTSMIYELSRERAQAQPASSLPALAPEYHDQFASLYEEIFPGAPYKPSSVALRNPPPRVALDDGRIIGFVALRLTPEFGNGELEHIGVAESARGRGLGRDLLRAAIQDAFSDPGMRTLVLNTNSANAVGQRLYESVGFVRGRNMVSFRTPRG